MPNRNESRSIAVIYDGEDVGGQALSLALVDGAREVHDTLAAMGHRVSLIDVDEGIRPLVERLDDLQPDAVFNLCEGFREWSPGEYCVAGLLDLLGIPYTGSGALALAVALDKPLSKELFIARQIPTPRFAVVRHTPAVVPALGFPLMMKLASEDASIGITPGNVVSDHDSAQARLQQLLDEHCAPVLVEEFIEGREFTVALLDGEPLVVEEIEIRVEPRIVSFDAKWTEGSAEHAGTIPVFTPDITNEQRQEIVALARRVWDVISLRDYGRVDFRMDACGRLYVLEANPNPDISRGSGYRRSLEVARVPYPDFIARLINNAIGRTR